MSALAEMVLDAARAKEAKLTTAESCTGGLIAAALTDVAGSSDVFDRGFITYSNNAKADMLGVARSIIAKNGAVSEPVAAAMARGAVERSAAAYAVSVTGIAGPGGGSDEKPVGLVYIGLASEGRTDVHRFVFEFGDDIRRDVREQTVQTALTLLYETLCGRP